MQNTKLHRRSFLKSFSAFAAPAMLGKITTIEKILTNPTLPNNEIQGEKFWEQIKQDFIHSDQLLNLNSGGLSPQPLIVQKLHQELLEFSNKLPTHNMWRVVDNQRESTRENLAQLAGCSPEEIAINRNATESLDTIISGIPLKKGDEIVMSKYDYPRMMAQLRRRELQEGIKLKYANLKAPMENEDEIVEAYTSQFTSKTKVVLLTHIINWNGQVIPVARIGKIAQERGILVIVDGAHSFANLSYRIDELNCDYFGASLHKWLCCPFGTGLLYIKKDKIKSIPPIFYSDAVANDNIRKFEELGTRNNAAEMCISLAIEYHNSIGTSKKGERLIYLRNYWTQKIKDWDKIKIKHPQNPNLSCGLGFFEVEGVSGFELYNNLMNKKIVTTPILHETLNGIRISPNIFTLPSDLDYFVEQMHKIIKGG